jgi:hypothetical protein
VLVGAINANVSGDAPLSVEVRTSDKAQVYVFQGVVESARRRIKLNRVGQGTSFDVITGTTGLPGTAIDYDLRFAIEGANSDVLIFWTQSDLTAIQFRRFKSDNTFGPITSLTNTTIDQTAFYPIGNGLIYTDSVAKFALVYYDVTTAALCMLRCTADASLDTAGNWAKTTVISGVMETNLCPPGFISRDAGKKIWAWGVDDTTRKFKYAHDAGTGTWAAPTDWKPAQTYSVAAASMMVLSDRITLVYLDDSGTPRVKYDQLFF